jgi:LPXTG-site transpeptidase (sortase) family protein
VVQLTFSRRTQLLLAGLQSISYATGAVAFLYVGFVLFDARFYQAQQSRALENALKNRGQGQPVDSVEGHSSLPSAPPFTSSRPLFLNRSATRASAPLGRIAIGAIGLDVIILEGTDDQTLRRGVGHIPGTSLPGQQGNIAIAGHRDTFFKGLRKIRKGDEITLTTLSGLHRYLVDFTDIVAPNNVAVLNESKEPILTLVTCYPFYYVGPSPQRFIVRAHRSPS